MLKCKIVAKKNERRKLEKPLKVINGIDLCMKYKKSNYKKSEGKYFLKYIHINYL